MAHRKRYTSTNLPKTKADLVDTAKWSLGDADTFGELLQSLEQDVLDIYKFKEVMAHTVNQIESQLLKGESLRPRNNAIGYSLFPQRKRGEKRF